MFTVRLPLNSKLLVVKFWESQKLLQIFNCDRGSMPLSPNSHVVQGSHVSFRGSTFSLTELFNDVIQCWDLSILFFSLLPFADSD